MNYGFFSAEQAANKASHCFEAPAATDELLLWAHDGERRIKRVPAEPGWNDAYRDSGVFVYITADGLHAVTVTHVSGNPDAAPGFSDALPVWALGAFVAPLRLPSLAGPALQAVPAESARQLADGSLTREQELASLRLGKELVERAKASASPPPGLR